MRSMTHRVFNRRVLLALGAVIFCSASMWAQQRPAIRRATVFTVKPDHTAEFEAAVKEYHDAYAKVPGVRSAGIFQSMSGPYRYVLVRDYEQWSDLDRGPASKAVHDNAELARIGVRINAAIESSVTMVEELLPDLSMTRPSGPPEIVRVGRSLIRPDKTKEFESIVKSELLPASQKAGIQGFTVRRVRYGGPTNEYYLSSRTAGWSDVSNNAIHKAMGDEAYKRMVEKLTAITLERELNLYRFRKDLSFKSPASGTKLTSNTR